MAALKVCRYIYANSIHIHTSKEQTFEESDTDLARGVFLGDAFVDLWPFDSERQCQLLDGRYIYLSNLSWKVSNIKGIDARLKTIPFVLNCVYMFLNSTQSI